MWVRGLKHADVQTLLSEWVAPYVGAWIETEVFSNTPRAARVAPYVGAWIETVKRHRAQLWRCRTLCGCVD